MRKIFIVVLLIIPFLLQGADARLIPRFKHLVENEPSDPFIEITGIIPAQYVAGHENEGDVSTEYSLLVNTFLIPVKFNSHTIMAIGAGFKTNRLHDAEHRFSSTVMSLYEHIFATGNITDNWYWLTYQAFGHYASYENDYFHESALKYQHLLGIGYKFNENFSVTIGLVYDTKFGYHSLLPVLRVGWSFDNFVITVFFPLYARVRYYITDYISMYAAAKYGQESFREEMCRGQGDYRFTEYGRFEINAGFEFFINGTVCIAPSFSYYFSSPVMRSRDSGKERVAALPEEYMLSLSVQLRI